MRTFRPLWSSIRSSRKYEVEVAFLGRTVSVIIVIVHGIPYKMTHIVIGIGTYGEAENFLDIKRLGANSV